MTDLYDLIIYDNEDGETVAKYSAEHLTRFCSVGEYIIVGSNQHEHDHCYPLPRYAFYFEGR